MWGSLTLVALVRRLVEVPRYIAMSAIGTQQTCSMRSRMSVFGGKADVDQPLLANLIYECTAHFEIYGGQPTKLAMN